MQPHNMSNPPGPDGARLVGDAGGYLDYLSDLSRQLGVPDPVEQYLRPVIGRWSALHEQAAKWRQAAQTFDEVSGQVTKPLGQLDTVWQGAAAESFVAYLQKFAPAGAGLTDAMNAIADALDHTANSIRELVKQLVDTLTEHARSTSGALIVPLQGTDRARDYLDQAQRPTMELFDAVEDVMEAFVKLCKGMHEDAGFGKVAVRNKFPAQSWSPPTPEPTPTPPTSNPLPSSTPLPAAPPPVPPSTTGTVPAADTTLPPAAPAPGGAAGGAVPAGGAVSGGGGVQAGAGAAPHAGGATSPPPLPPGGAFGAAESAEHPAVAASDEHAPSAGPAAGSSGQSGSPGGMGMMGGGGMGGGQGGDQERKSKSRLTSEAAELFGRPPKTAPPVIGE